MSHNNQGDLSVESDPWQEEEAEEEEDGPEPSLMSEGGLHIGSPDDLDIEAGPDSLSRLALPVWLREQSKAFRYRWVPLPLRRLFRVVNDWTFGPEETQVQRITPWFPSVQRWPLTLVDVFLPLRWHKIAALSTLLGIWLLTFCLVINTQQSSGQIEGHGHPVPIWCGANYWNAGNGCGIDGNDCRPFDNSSLPFKCNANCLGVEQLETYAIGDQEVQYTPLVIGGPDKKGGRSFYRADSFICQAAIHAGVVSNEFGGCGVVELSGARESFTASSNNKILSYAFDASFPKSFTFRPNVSSDCGSVDLRWALLGVTMSVTVLISLFVSSPTIFFSCVFVLIFFHVGMVSDRPNVSDIPSLFSIIIGRFLPAAFVASALFTIAVQPQLEGLMAQIEKTFLWLGAVWFGSLSNYTLDWIPVQRLTPHDLKQPGAVLAVILIVLLIASAAAGQIYYLRLERRLRKYLAIYSGMGLLLLIGVAIPQLNLRIHHYILALLLIPGTRTQTRPALIYQGLLLGLFINGIARWGFDSVLQTSYELFHGGDVRSLLPNVTATAVYSRNITFDWSIPPEGYDGVSVLINDVERKRWYVGEGSPTFTWEREVDEDLQDGEKSYFRFAYMTGSSAQDYTKTGTWQRNGTWMQMEPGTSNAK